LVKESPADGYSVLQLLKKQVSGNKKALVTLYLELDEERSAATVVANYAMAVISDDELHSFLVDDLIDIFNINVELGLIDQIVKYKLLTMITQSTMVVFDGEGDGQGGEGGGEGGEVVVNGGIIFKSGGEDGC
ncbi:probable myosin-binding protein 5, partial [Tanacetum coccineum]